MWGDFEGGGIGDFLLDTFAYASPLRSKTSNANNHALDRCKYYQVKVIAMGLHVERP